MNIRLHIKQQYHQEHESKSSNKIKQQEAWRGWRGKMVKNGGGEWGRLVVIRHEGQDDKERWPCATLLDGGGDGPAAGRRGKWMTQHVFFFVLDNCMAGAAISRPSTPLYVRNTRISAKMTVSTSRFPMPADPEGTQVKYKTRIFHSWAERHTGI